MKRGLVILFVVLALTKERAIRWERGVGDEIG